MASLQINYLKESAEVIEGVALGDAFGETYSYYAYEVRERVAKELHQCQWRYTDDTIMSLGVLECLARFGEINQDVLAWIFSKRYMQDTERGYGRMARKTLEAIAKGESWVLHSERAFQGGSMGNGAAMRAHAIGIWFRDDISKLVNQAKLSAKVTHWHHEGQMGAVAVALATAGAALTKKDATDSARNYIAGLLTNYLDESEVRRKCLLALELKDLEPLEAARKLGAGQEILAQDTAPYSIWCALNTLDDYKEAILCSVEANGDCDTVAAIAGGIVTARLGKAGLPSDWMKQREPLVFQAH